MTNLLLVEKVAEAIANFALSRMNVLELDWNEMGEERRPYFRDAATAAIAAMPGYEAGLVEGARARGEPTEAMWGGLARDIMMWLDFGDKTPRALFKHLERCGRPIPQWLRDEPEMKNLDHVPSKGTRCVIIWRAMEEVRLFDGKEGAG